MLVAEVYLPAPEVNVTATTVQLEKFNFSSTEIIRHSHTGVGSGNWPNHTTIIINAHANNEIVCLKIKTNYYYCFFLGLYLVASIACQNYY